MPILLLSLLLECLTQVSERLAMQAFCDIFSKLVLDRINRLKSLIFRAGEI
jgi:hypothetical protein